ncbi:MAG: bifunctional DNA-formamidopyrimidine glycosylase/DNA-(apurinic or apyrimidinic site) lyase [Deltaproteobacteria bacterium]|nr:bifunctional DNA-formamidopyrimidine glycosylase/DNA-(apurinic or apyrimidinic site) lyase [Deltaproteobacteria bacterium]MBW2360917.1 bifunctional DNA-formamidopyrimidine glycosylase/DNA-(apurinic or apyrimidinic site) lyase [Deltaproteobacteria bacterium]
MPELPEVEVTRRRIEPLLVGRRIRRLETTGQSYFFLTQPARLKRRLKGRTVECLERVGKYLVLLLDDGGRLVIHLGMTGQLFGAGASSLRLLSATARAALTPEQQQSFRPDAHTHLRFRFDDDGPAVFLRDVRKFGKVLWLAPGEAHPRLERLGVDALSVTGDLLFGASRKRDTAVKSFLLDQSIVAGIGNIYADEALHLAKLRPTRRARRLTRAECEKLAEALRGVLERSIETGGSSIRDYVTPDGSDGGFQDERRVYARKGEPCCTCGTAVRRIVVGQRSTHYCASCQR